MRAAQPSSLVSDRKPFVLPKVEEQPAMTVLTQGIVLVSGQAPT
ncbi:MAG TPA: hypothetical protein VJ596_05805 [Gemmatimonadaceae bacterium]|nr:hypothetical protein [Gemmatimonadaceae bacterium]